ncbi:MAG: TlpA family protein disulfide reductase [Spirochaetaceae bacterium]|nr:TlpA family protein disulfide reductase [Spirochaetaceae bacterium]
MQKRQRPGKLIVVSIFFLLLSMNRGMTAAETTRPWYAPKFEKLGFYVFDPPLMMKDFLVLSVNGSSKTRASAKGNIVLLNFWATWCPPCREEMPGIETLSKLMKGKKFEIMAVNLGDSAADVKAFLQEFKYTFPIYLDTQNKLSASFASQGIPSTYVLDKQGRFIAGVVGSFDYTNPELVGLLTTLAEQ